MSVVDQLLEDSAEGLTLDESRALWTETLDESQVPHACDLVREHPDAGAYHLLIALRRSAPEAYAAIPQHVRAEVLLDVLRRQRTLNDWGYLDTAGSYDGPAAQALLETGVAARPGLATLLSDGTPVDLEGSEESLLADEYRYRRADYAYRYLAKVLGRDPLFSADHEERDAAIERMRAELGV